jgi:hypothetical protein
MSDNLNAGGRPAIGEPINVRLGDENLAWLDRGAAKHDTSRANILRSVVTAAREAAQKPGRTLPQHAADMVDRFGHHCPGSADRFANCRALWLAFTETGNEYLKRYRKAEADADTAYDDPWPVEVVARITALQGAANASFEAAAVQEEEIFAIIEGIERDAHEAGINVYKDL